MQRQTYLCEAPIATVKRETNNNESRRLGHKKKMSRTAHFTRKITVTDENGFDTSISYPYNTCSPKLTHQRTGHRNTSARNILFEEKALCFAELVTPVHMNHAPGHLTILDPSRRSHSRQIPLEEFPPLNDF